MHARVGRYVVALVGLTLGGCSCGRGAADAGAGPDAAGQADGARYTP